MRKFIGPYYDTAMTSKFAVRIAMAIASGAFALPMAAIGQTPTPQPAANSKPASMEVMNSMTLAAAVSACELAIGAKLPLQTAVLASSSAISFVVTSQFGSKVDNSPKLQPEQILNGAIIQTVVPIKGGCYTKLNDTDKKFVDEVIMQAQKQMGSKKN